MDTAIAALPEALVREVEKLSAEQRLAPIDAPWDGLEGQERDFPELSADQRRILDGRIEEFERNPDLPRKTLAEILAKHDL